MGRIALLQYCIDNRLRESKWMGIVKEEVEDKMTKWMEDGGRRAGVQIKMVRCICTTILCIIYINVCVCVFEIKGMFGCFE